MTREEAITKLRSLQAEDDLEHEHYAADQVLCKLLCAIGYEDVIAEWEKVGKWYA